MDNPASRTAKGISSIPMGNECRAPLKIPSPLYDQTKTDIFLIKKEKRKSKEE